jgi:hypothetical protein
MTDLRAAAQQALKALVARGQRGDGAPDTVAALRAALAQEEQEPVAWMVYTLDGKSVCVTDNPADFAEGHRALPLYPHPPRREWQGLTDEEIWELSMHSRLQFARDIEQALKERNT